MDKENAPETSNLIPYTLLGLPVHWTETWDEWLVDRVRKGLGARVVTLNAEMAMQAAENPPLRQAIVAADASIPDGSGVVLALGWRGIRVRRTPGIELAEALLARLAREGECPRAFFYGGQPGVARSAAIALQHRYPGLEIDSEHGYLSESELPAMRDRLQQFQPAIVLVGLGVPRQELWIADNYSLCPTAIWMGVGGSFDIWAGVKTRAPAWMGNAHLEWAYRLYKEPWRWRRMLALPRFAWRATIGDRF